VKAVKSLLLATLLGGVVLGVGVFSARGQEGEKPEKAVAKTAPAACDLKKVVKMDYCPGCSMVLSKEDLNDKGQCRLCGEESKVEKVDVCTKTLYECCGKQAVAAFSCDKCGEEASGRTVNARVIFVCKGCGGKSDKAGNCAAAQCTAAGKPLARTCELSGKFPHGGVQG
jgi:hypothetical protein